MSIQVFGLGVSRGVAIGRAVLVASSRVDVAHYFVEADRVEREVERLAAALQRVAVELEALQHDLPADAPGELAALLDVHLMLLRDEDLFSETRRWIVERRYNAEWALSAHLEVLARQFDEMEDAYLRERKADLEQVVERVLKALATPRPGRDTATDGTEGLVDAVARHGGASVLRSMWGTSAPDSVPLILVASDISPADMLQFKRSVFGGFVTDVGGTASHTAIVARSMDIPAVVAARDASRVVRHDDLLIVDGDHGILLVNPSPIVLEEYRFRQRQSVLERERLSRLRNTPAVTLDGQPIGLLANIEMPDDAAAALEAGAVGVGLFRSEFLFMNRGGDLPGEDEQYEAYRAVVMAMRGLPVTIRTIDIGADKPLERMSLSELRHEHQLNPALGLRAIRWSLAEPAMFRQQLRAILRASVHGPVRILLPMVGQLVEARHALEHVARARYQLTDAGKRFGYTSVGLMVEVPAAALALRKLLSHFDFASIGTNDLVQYTLAIDRSDEAVSHLYDPWNPAVLTLLASSIEVSRQMGKDSAVCGEMAGDPAFTATMLGMGLRNFSMHPARLAAVKQVILRSDTAQLRRAVVEVLAADDPQSCARDHGLTSPTA